MSQVLINLLPYRPIPTGLSRYAERLLMAWPENPEPLDCRLLVLGPSGRAQLDDLQGHLPQYQSSRLRRWLQANGLAQYGVALSRALNGFDPGVIYSPYSECLLKIHDRIQFITCHDLIPIFYPNSRRSKWYAQWCLPRHLERADHLIAISNTVADQLVDIGVSADRIEVVYNGVSMPEHPLQAPASEDVLVVARHAKHKNIGLALEGFSRFLTSQPHWSGDLVIVGSRDRETSQLLRLESELALVGRVRWLHHLSDAALLRQIRSSFCLLSPSRMEGFDYPLLEAQAEGLPTLASRIPVHRELHKGCCLLFALDDRGLTLGTQLQRLARDPGLWKQLSHLGRSNASRFSLKRQVRQIQGLLPKGLCYP
jgi:glycosyltransferase involved in cell wall biosynthesis